jgi:hypothetical protein
MRNAWLGYSSVLGAVIALSHRCSVRVFIVTTVVPARGNALLEKDGNECPWKDARRPDDSRVAL